MASHLAIIAGLALAVAGYTFFIERVVNDSPMSGDRWYVRQFAFVGGPVSPPYCWRPLLPLLARYLGFNPDRRARVAFG